MPEKNLCERCYWRKESRKAVAEHMKRMHPDGKGPCGHLILDAAPKAECKMHEGYGHKSETREMCDDFR